MQIFTKLLAFSFLLLFTHHADAQLMNHGDYSFNQLNIHVKYINESNNVLGLIYKAVNDEEAKKTLIENFENSLYHVSAMTIQDRQTCLFMDAVINSNSRRHKGKTFVALSEALNELKTAESELNDYVLSTTDKLKNIENLSIPEAKIRFITIYEKQNAIMGILNKESSTFDECLMCDSVGEIYADLTSLLDLNTSNRIDLKTKINEQLEGFDFAPFDDLMYPKQVLTEAFAKVKIVVDDMPAGELSNADRNRIILESINTTDGIPELLSKALELYKNTHKEVKFIKFHNLPIHLE